MRVAGILPRGCLDQAPTDSVRWSERPGGAGFGAGRGATLCSGPARAPSIGREPPTLGVPGQCLGEKCTIVEQRSEHAGLKPFFTYCTLLTFRQ